ncbi:MAG: HAMP domain-containing histidine kinase [Defluviitaleaceae bacterium]|nr:HAMP domain-containing histidine kinase [Defluviitaleaceae bacterium]
MKKSFANRLMLNFTCVVFVGFLMIYFLFNVLIDNHIRAEAEAALSHEFTIVNETELIPTLPFFPFNDTLNFQIGLNRLQSSRSIVNVHTIVIDQNDVILYPDPQHLSPIEIDRIKALATFWNEHQSLFEASEDMIMTAHEGHTFYMRATSHYLIHRHVFFFESTPVSVLIYTDITPAMNLKNSMNHVLLALLAILGTLTLGISFLLSTRFKQAIKRLSVHAQTIGQGHFDQKIKRLRYLEFEQLGNSMNTMADMLNTYETNQKQFFQNASHELRTPLMSIQGYAEGIQLGVFENDEATDVILEESHKMTELINDILYLSKLNTAEDFQMAFRTITVDALMKRCIKRVNILAEKENKQLFLDTSLEIDFETDADKLERAIINILSNAIRYAQAEIRLNCKAEADFLCMTIFNDGPAIDEKDLPYLFDRFYKGRSGNTGLGLAITKDIIIGLGGQIEAKNLEKGVVFKLQLPLKQSLNDRLK